MKGCIAGDVVGSTLEYKSCKDYSFPILCPHSHITDDTIMAVAVTQAAMDDMDNYEDMLVKWGLAYIEKDYGPSFRRWLMDYYRTPYNSWGNGSAMRIGGIPWIAKGIAETENMAIRSALPTHNHCEGIIGACAVAVATRMALEGYSKNDIEQTITEHYGYDLSFDIHAIKKTYTYDVSCQGTVPIAIKCFLVSSSYEDAIRLAISMGGDADTLGAITGNIAEAFYGMDEEIWKKVFVLIPDDIKCVLKEFQAYPKTLNKTPINLIGRQENYRYFASPGDFKPSSVSNVNNQSLIRKLWKRMFT